MLTPASLQDASGVPNSLPCSDTASVDRSRGHACCRWGGMCERCPCSQVDVWRVVLRQCSSLITCCWTRRGCMADQGVDTNSLHAQVLAAKDPVRRSACLPSACLSSQGTCWLVGTTTRWCALVLCLGCTCMRARAGRARRPCRGQPAELVCAAV